MTLEQQLDAKHTELMEARGFITQLMRQNEMNARTLSLTLSGVVREQTRTTARIEKMIDEVSELIMAMNEALRERAALKSVK